MKTIKTQSNDLIVVEIPDDSYELEILSIHHLRYKTKGFNHITGTPFISHEIKLESNKIAPKYKILGKLSELDNKNLEKFVENNKIDKFRTKDYYKDYINKHATPFLKSAKQSFISLLQSNEIDTSKELLIIEVL